MYLELFCFDMEISKEQEEQLKKYVDFLLKYNEKINLIGKSTIDDIWNRHIIDSLQVIKLIENKNVKLADLGSGAGLPGIVLSIAGIKEVHLFEKSPRKCEFLEQAKQFSKNQIIVHNIDINTFKDNSFNIITSRALGSLDLLLKFSQNLKNNNTKCIFLKGKKVFEELKEAKKYWKMEYNLVDSLTSNEGKIVEVKQFHKNNH